MRPRSLKHYAIQAALIPLFRSSSNYWNRRYALGGDSGSGSFGEIAAYKAGYLNSFGRDNAVNSVIEFGCGNGQQLRLAEYPKYLGFDVSTTAVDACLSEFHDDRTKSFICLDSLRFRDNARFLKADSTLSIDVVFHLVEDAVYERHLDLIFNASQCYCIIYSTNVDERSAIPHVRHRAFVRDVEAKYPDWSLLIEEPPPMPKETLAGFFVFTRRTDS